MTCIVRLPLLGPRQKVLGYKLAWQATSGDSASRPDLPMLAATVARRFEGTDTAGNGSLIFLQAPPGRLAPDSLQGLTPAGTVLSLTAAELDEPAVFAAVQHLREQGFGLCVRELDLQPDPRPAWLPLLTHREFDWGGAARARQLPSSGEVAAAQPCLVASGLAHPEEFQACDALGVHAFVDPLLTAPVGAADAARLSPESLLILQLMQMVQANADLRHIESALKRDAALAYQLLRYLNSASFGLGVEVQSLRHALTMVGYGPLHRWLAVLLAGSSAHPGSQALLVAAIVRGRFTELLGQGMLPQSDAENLFITGMFSLLDRLLGVPMASILERIQLPETVVQALLTREGMYGPFLRLVEACERSDGDAAALADSAFLTGEQVDRAHVAALAWSLELRV
ncbi:HDOD domain-containing protein [Ramlibacter tataouinensis]|uniref:EAL and HDOD domain-containing protein n=1 Tax=Ramlibacter tataouinensis TaxID=94132 RepID=UPI0022F3F776|nr:HDOD domain-containing protein [Ramlibacter tataouinensis]WBY00578.1 HDOD domain-containing protein [Ramlibacter tataouinensis]